MKTVRTRFAPSPTGFLHIGGVRTALFNYLFAKSQGGEFILRLEDTDRERFMAEGVDQIVEALDWLGLVPDKGFWISQGKHQGTEYVQSERQKTGLYQEYAQELLNSGLAYYSPTTPTELDNLRQKARETKKPFLYRKELDSKNTSEKQENCPIRFDVKAFFDQTHTADRHIKWQEPTSREPAGWNGDLIEDFIIIKADGFPTYNFANVVDDHKMEITHVLRGDEFFSSTPKHILLYQALGFDQPQFVHLPVINGTDGKKLSKRTGDTNTLAYRDKGYLPVALLNFLALLGWNDGTQQEIFTPEELASKFGLDRLGSSSAVFDHKRLDWINGHYIRQMDLDILFDSVKNFWPPEAQNCDDDYKKQVLGLVQERLKYFAELPDISLFFFKDLPVDPELISGHKQLKKLDKPQIKDLLQQAGESLDQSDFTPDDLTKRLNDLLQSTGQKPAVLFSLIRIATTQAPASPGLADTLAVLGKKVSMRRLHNQTEHI